MPISIAVLANSEMQNIFTPLPMGVHFVFCLIATAVYLALYARKDSPHYLVLMAAVDLTFLTQINTSSVTIGLLGAGEIVLLIAAAVMSYRFNKSVKDGSYAKKKAAAAEEDDDDEDDED
ncbi:MAG: hypothetical protein IJ737_00385 [Ruminococcus sp.]|nr:hypothetical protein [Ruminococcus sp.]